MKSVFSPRSSPSAGDEGTDAGWGGWGLRIRDAKPRRLRRKARDSFPSPTTRDAASRPFLIAMISSQRSGEKSFVCGRAAARSGHQDRMRRVNWSPHPNLFVESPNSHLACQSQQRPLRAMERGIRTLDLLIEGRRSPLHFEALLLRLSVLVFANKAPRDSSLSASRIMPELFEISCAVDFISRRNSPACILRLGHPSLSTLSH